MKYLLGIILLIPAISIFAQVNKTIDSSNSLHLPIQLKTNTGVIEGTLMLPDGFDHGKVVLIIAGSGPTDRDGNNTFMKNNSLLQLAEGLAAKGIASLRYDKRGIAASAAAMTNEEDIRFDHYIEDAKEWLLLLKKDKRFSSVIVAGHSEGSLIGMVAANGTADKYISLAGAGEPISHTLKRQLQTQAPKFIDRCNSIIDSLNKGFIVSNTPTALASIFRPSVQPYLISWFKYNPQIEIARLKMPVLIIQGEKDLQVTVEDAKMLSAAKPDATLCLIKDMNHVFKTVSDNKDNYKSYGEPNRPINEEMLIKMTEFIMQEN